MTNARGTEWVGGSFVVPSFNSGKGAPYRPTSVVWVHDKKVLAFNSVKPGEEASALVESFLRTTAESSPDKAMPTRVRVASPDLAEALRAALPATVQVQLAATPEIDDAQKRYHVVSVKLDGSDEADEADEADELDEADHTRSHFGEGQPDAQQWAEFYRACFRLYSTSAWEDGAQRRVHVPPHRRGARRARRAPDHHWPIGDELWLLALRR